MESILSFNQEKVVFETTFSSLYNYEKNAQKLVTELIDFYYLNKYIKTIDFNLSSVQPAGYNFKMQKLFFDFEKIIFHFKKKNCPQNLIWLNLLRIIFHELQHIFQYKIALENIGEIQKIYYQELFVCNEQNSLSITEFNADFLSSMIIMKNSKLDISEFSVELNYILQILKKYYINTNNFAEKFIETEKININYNDILYDQLLVNGFIDYDNDIFVKKLIQ